MNGIIVIDKENGYTSFDVVAKMRRICGEKKIGHTGTLDPMATGVLPILIGNATKAQSLLPESDKEYEATLSFGITTDTLDITGKVLSQTESNVKSEDLEAVLPQFRGDIMQLPPMYSAVSKDGVRLYELARKGLVTEREARPITVYKLDLLNFDEQLQSAQILVKCSKGTYIRSICDDIGQALGCGAVMTSLRRVTACGYTLDDAITLEKAKELSENGMLEEYLRPTESVFACYPLVKVTEAQAVNAKTNAGASHNVKRSPFKIYTKAPYFFTSNIDTAYMKFASKIVVFLPDKIIIVKGTKVGMASYKDLNIIQSYTPFIESDKVPSDAEVLRYTWKYVNRDGGPDKRFKNNRQYPVCKYGDLIISEGNNLYIRMMCSNYEKSEIFSEDFLTRCKSQN